MRSRKKSSLVRRLGMRGIWGNAEVEEAAQTEEGISGYHVIGNTSWFEERSAPRKRSYRSADLVFVCLSGRRKAGLARL